MQTPSKNRSLIPTFPNSPDPQELTPRNRSNANLMVDSTPLSISKSSMKDDLNRANQEIGHLSLLIETFRQQKEKAESKWTEHQQEYNSLQTLFNSVEQ